MGSCTQRYLPPDTSEHAPPNPLQPRNKISARGYVVDVTSCWRNACRKATKTGAVVRCSIRGRWRGGKLSSQIWLGIHTITKMVSCQQIVTHPSEPGEGNFIDRDQRVIQYSTPPPATARKRSFLRQINIVIKIHASFCTKLRVI